MVKNSPIAGFTTNEGLMLDLDMTTLNETRHIAEKYLERFELEGYLIARSSECNHHIIFNRYLPWEKTIEYLFKITWWYHYHRHGSKPTLTNWAILQAIKHSETLRITNKYEKPKPKIIETQGKTDKLINDYLQLYNTV